MTQFVILVEFALEPGAQARFEELVLENAKASREDEPGCRVFDVLHRAEAEFPYVLYEIYDDHAAFEAHLESAHFARFDASVKPLVRDKKVTQLRLLSDPPS